MTETLKISSAAPARTSMNYAALRENGMELIRALTKESWTDHNVHDPGITLLEAFSYAMTELGFRIQLDMPDLLQSGAHHVPPDLVPAHRVLPCAPVTPRDLRAVLLDDRLIRDARITTNVSTEIPFFEDTASVPPFFTYTPNATPVVPHGLYEAVVEFAERDLNSNTYTLTVTVSSMTYTLDMALPYWDEDEARPFQDGPVINSVTMLTDGGVHWRALEESQSFFGEIRVDYNGTGGPGSMVLWVLLRITDELPQPAFVTPGILGAALVAVQTTGVGSLIDSFAQRVRSAYGAVQQVSRYLSTYRNLCEDLVHIGVARVQEITVRARIEVTGSADLEQLLADIFLAVDRMLAPPVQFVELAARCAVGADIEQIYDGPLLRNGFLDDTAIAPNDAAVIYVSDILRLIMRRRGSTGTDLVAQENPSGRDIVAVTDLALSNYINNRPITVDVQDCLHLVETERYRPRFSLAKSRIVFVRNDAEVQYDIQRARNLFTAMREAGDAALLPAEPSSLWPVARGKTLPVEDYIPLQNELPRNYGVGEARLPDNVGVERHAAVLQLKGYLMLFEQFLADLTAQLGNINRFFSADPEEQATYFSRALFELPDVQKLLLQFPAGSDWTSFITDPDNPYSRALQLALESRERFLDRRNRMFDHLLARQGEEMVTFGQELHRYAQRELQEGAIDPIDLPARMGARRQAANAGLIRAKAALLRDAPWLNGARLQAFGNPLQHDESILQIERSGMDFHWTLVLEGEALLRGVDDYSTRAAAVIAAEEAVVLAAQANLFAVVSAGGGRRYQLQDSSGAAVRVIGESQQTYASITSAQNAALACAQSFAALRIAASLTPLEQRVAHLSGIRSLVRRRLLAVIDAFFEIYDEVDSDSIIEKRWRLWELPGYNGRVMLSSVFHFEAATDGEAVALAEESIRKVLRYGQDEWNYAVSPAGVGTYNFDLWHPNGDKIGMRNPPFPSEAAARSGINETLAHLYHHYSAEGFHLVEHLLLRPRQNSDAFLSFPVDLDTLERDPYSQRLSLVFPSGWMRDDFSQHADKTLRSATEPHRFRDLEFRSHVERMVQQSCPAHVLPSIFWVDRQTPGTPTALNSFDGFEQAYFDWLDTVLIPGATPAASALARTALIQALNGIAHG